MNESSEIIKLLTEIKSLLSSSDSTAIYTAIIGASAALMGALIVGLVNYFTVKLSAKHTEDQIQMKIKAELISKQRQEWMDSIRDVAKDLVTDFYLLHNLINAKTLTEEKGEELYASILRHSTFIELKLNPEKDYQKRVVDAMSKIKYELMIQMHQHGEMDSTKYSKLLTEFKDSLVDLFGKTWQRIKKLED